MLASSAEIVISLKVQLWLGCSTLLSWKPVEEKDDTLVHCPFFSYLRALIWFKKSILCSYFHPPLPSCLQRREDNMWRIEAAYFKLMPIE